MIKINKLIGKDLTLKMEQKYISDYHIHTKLKICSPWLLKCIKNGLNENNIPLRVIIEIYKAIGEGEINVKDNGNTLVIKF